MKSLIAVVVMCVAISETWAETFIFYQDQSPVALISTENIESSVTSTYEILEKVISFTHVKKVADEKVANATRKFYWFGKDGKPFLKTYFYEESEEKIKNIIEKIKDNYDPDLIYKSTLMDSYWHRALNKEPSVSTFTSINFFKGYDNLYFEGLLREETKKQIIKMRNIDAYVWGHTGEILFSKGSFTNKNLKEIETGTVFVKDDVQFVLDDLDFSEEKLKELVSISSGNCAYMGKVRKFFYCYKLRFLDEVFDLPTIENLRLVFDDSTKVITEISTSNKNDLYKKILKTFNPIIAYSYEHGFANVTFGREMIKGASKLNSSGELIKFNNEKRTQANLTIIDGKTDFNKKVIDFYRSEIPHDKYLTYSIPRNMVPQKPFFSSDENLTGIFKYKDLPPPPKKKEIINTDPVHVPLVVIEPSEVEKNFFKLDWGYRFGSLESDAPASFSTLLRGDAQANSAVNLGFGWRHQSWILDLNFHQITYEYSVDESGSIRDVKGKHTQYSVNLKKQILQNWITDYRFKFGLGVQNNDYEIEKNSVLNDFESISYRLFFTTSLELEINRVLSFTASYRAFGKLEEEGSSQEFDLSGYGLEVRYDHQLSRHWSYYILGDYEVDDIGPESGPDFEIQRKNFELGFAFHF